MRHCVWHCVCFFGTLPVLHRSVSHFTAKNPLPSFKTFRIQSGFLQLGLQSLRQLIILLSCSRRASSVVAINMGAFTFINVVCISGFINSSFPNIFIVLVKVALQDCFDSPTVCENTRCFTQILVGFRFGSFECSIYTQVLVQSTCSIRW